MVSVDNVMGSFLEKLYQQLGGGDAKVMDDPNSFIAFCPGGIAVQPQQFVFAGDVANYVLGVADELGQPKKDVKPEDRTPEAQAIRQRQVYLYEKSWSELVNFHPATDGLVHAAETKRNVCLYKPEGECLWNAYSTILDQMEVPEYTLTDEQKAKVAAAYGLLQVQAPKRDMMGIPEKDADGNPVLEPQVSPQKLAYNKYMNAFVDACSEYTSLMASQFSSPAEAMKWNSLGSTLKRRASVAMEEWDTLGYRKAVEGAGAYIDNVNAGAMDLIVKNMRDAMKTPRAVDDNQYFSTSMLSNAFASSAKGWTGQYFKEADFQQMEKSASNKWNGRAGFRIPGFGIGGKAGGANAQSSTQMDMQSFSMDYKLTLVPIMRPWFHPEFLRSKSWRFKPSFQGNMVSDGGRPPRGTLTGYTTMAIFVRDVFIRFANVSKFTQEITSRVQGGGSVNFLGFDCGGSYGHKDSTEFSKLHQQGQGIYIPGMQLMGFVSKLLPKTPDPAAGVFK